MAWFPEQLHRPASGVSVRHVPGDGYDVTGRSLALFELVTDPGV